MRKIVVTSGKGGVGKTTVTATLGRKLALQGYKVVLVDGDVGLNNLDVVTGIERRVVYDIGDVLAGRCRAFQALVQDGESPMRVLPSIVCKPKSSSMMTSFLLSLASKLSNVPSRRACFSWSMKWFILR